MVVHDRLKRLIFPPLGPLPAFKKHCFWKVGKRSWQQGESLPFRTHLKNKETTRLIRDFGGVRIQAPLIQFQANPGPTPHIQGWNLLSKSCTFSSFPTGHWTVALARLSSSWGQTTPQRCSAFLGWLFNGHVSAFGPSSYCDFEGVCFFYIGRTIPLWCIFLVWWWISGIESFNWN